jgi:hypothetical protein
VIDGEPLYEDHPLDFRAAQNGWSFDAHVRQRAYWDVFAGAAGTPTATTRCGSSMRRAPADQRARRCTGHAIHRPGAAQIPLVRRLIESRTTSRASPTSRSSSTRSPASTTSRRQRGDGYAFVYSAQGRPFDVVMGKISGDSVVAQWFNPRSGDYLPFGRFAKPGRRNSRRRRRGSGRTGCSFSTE